ncbi:MAG TPA: glycosyltransferase [Bryobacteraceae bacterium]|jgi:glycosyltransferase involved in cell wall biosynthesis|nr:glycosyltransferase [Bryobacteraceae bacterium]
MNVSTNVSTAPEVSAVMTTFNVANFVADALRSALDQTFHSIEIVVVDDGSTDGTASIVRGFNDSRIRLIEGAHNGRCHALNIAVNLARGEFLAMLDGDDIWHPEKLAAQMAYMRKHSDVDLTFSWSRIIDENGSDTGLTTRKWRGPVSFGQLLKDYVIGNGSSAVIRRASFLKLGPFDKDMDGCLDYDACLRLALFGPGKLVCIPAYLTYYRRRSGQVTRDLNKVEQGHNRMLEKMLRLAPVETTRVAAAARSNMSRFFAYLAYESGDFGQANRYLLRGLRHAPLTFLCETRNWKLAMANAAAGILPNDVYRRLLRMALRVR